MLTGLIIGFVLGQIVGIVAAAYCMAARRDEPAARAPVRRGLITGAKMLSGEFPAWGPPVREREDSGQALAFR